ncbi:MAG: von Willebrand factor type A domain-containing protein [Alphaproteobacteria bacterium]
MTQETMESARMDKAKKTKKRLRGGTALKVIFGLMVLHAAAVFLFGHSSYSPSTKSYGGCPMGSCKMMSQNVISASSGFSNLNSLNPIVAVGSMFQSSMQGSISSGSPTKLNGQALLMDSVTIFEGGGYGGTIPYTPPAQVAQNYYAPPAYTPPPVYTTSETPQPNTYYKDNGRDAFPGYTENEVKAVKAEPVSTFSIDVDTASYSFVRRMINEGAVPAKDSVRIEELVNYFPYDYAVPDTREVPFLPTVAVYPSPYREGAKLLHIGIKGFMPKEKPQSNLVFLIDTSGSMNSPDKLPLVVNSFKLLLESLAPEDTVSIVTYAGTSGIALQPVKASEKKAILRVLDGLASGGGTAGQAGIQAAYDLAAQNFIKEGNNRVILATDGDFNVGLSRSEDLTTFIEGKREKGIFLTVLGYGAGNYHDVTMQALAQAGNGTAAYIDNLNEARKVLVEEAPAALFTIAKDVKIQVEFNPALVQDYRLIGYETRKLKREDFANDKVDAGEIGAGHAVTAIYEYTPVGATALVEESRYNKEDKRTAGGETTPKADEVAHLRIRYKLPDGAKSNLITYPVTTADEQPLDQQSDDIRFAAAVTGFGQLMRGSKFAGDTKWDDIIDLAARSRGKDEYGYRMEFLNLAKLAKTKER